MIKIKKYVIEEKELDLEYDEEFILRGITYKITSDNQLYEKCNDSWMLSDFYVVWVYENRDMIKKLLQQHFWAEDGDCYYFMSTDLDSICKTEFKSSCSYDIMRRKLGNCFKTDRITKEQINEYLNKLNNKEIL